MVRRRKRRSSARRRSFFVAGALSAILLLGDQGSADLLYRQRILPGISINGIALGGMHRSAAQAHLDQLMQQYGNQSLLLRGAGRTWTLPLSYLLNDFSAQAASAAWRPGHDTSLARQITDRIASLRGDQLSLALPIVKRSAVDRLVRQLATSIDHPPQDARIVRNSDGWQVLPDQSGMLLDRDAAIQRIQRAIEQLPIDASSSHVQIELPVRTVEPHLRAVTFMPLRDTLERLRTAPLIVETGSQSWTLDRSSLVRWGPEGVTGAGRTTREGRPLVEPDRDAIARQLRALAQESNTTVPTAHVDLVRAVP